MFSPRSPLTRVSGSELVQASNVPFTDQIFQTDESIDELASVPFVGESQLSKYHTVQVEDVPYSG